MYFANVIKSDDNGGYRYYCTIQNTKLRYMAQGDDAVVKPFVAGSVHLCEKNCVPS